MTQTQNTTKTKKPKKPTKSKPDNEPAKTDAPAETSNLPMRLPTHRHRRRPKHIRKRNPRRTALRFTPYAWAKLIWFRDRGDTEIGGFAVTADDDPLLVIDFVTVNQINCPVSVRFDDDAVADYFDRQVDQGRKPANFARIWLHSHPGDSANPSSTDEETFERCFGECDWCLMFILAQDGATYARLRFNVGPGGDAVIPVEIDYSGHFGAVDEGVRAVWETEYQSNVHPLPYLGPVHPRDRDSDDHGDHDDDVVDGLRVLHRFAENGVSGIFDDRDWMDQYDIDDDLADDLDELAEWQAAMEAAEEMELM